MASAPKLPRKLKEKIDGKDVYVRELVNDDLDEIDEIDDEYDEIRRQIADLQTEIDETEDADERKTKRAKNRELAKERRRIETHMLGLYVEDTNGETYAQETLAAVPVRAQSRLLLEAAKKVYGEDPTPAASASA